MLISSFISLVKTRDKAANKCISILICASIGEWTRWQSRKTLSSPPPMDTPKLELFTEQLLMRKTGRLAENSCYSKDIYKERTTTRQVGGAEMWNSQDPYLQMGNLKQENDYNCRISPQGVQASHQTSQPSGPAPGR